MALLVSMNPLQWAMGRSSAFFLIVFPSYKRKTLKVKVMIIFHLSLQCLRLGTLICSSLGMKG